MIYRIMLLHSQLEMESSHDVMGASTTLTELGVCRHLGLLWRFADEIRIPFIHRHLLKVAMIRTLLC